MKIARRRWIVFSGVVAVALLIVITGSRTTVGRAVVRSYLPWLETTAPAPVKPIEPLWPESVFDCEPGVIGWIEPGTIIDDGPPEDWSHLVLKNATRVVAGERGKQAARWNQMAEMFSLALVADVGRLGNDYFLARIGTGWCHPVNGHDTVISSTSRSKVGVKLPMMAALSLGVREVECDEKTRVMARSASTLIYEVERVLAFGDQHLSGHLRYAVLVHPHTGELAAYLWMVPPAEIEPPADAHLERLPPSCVTTFGLRYRPSRSGMLSMPAADDYAVATIPEGMSRLPIDDALLPLVYAPQFDQDRALALEARLRDDLGWQ